MKRSDVLLVERDLERRQALLNVLTLRTHVDACETFVDARAMMLQTPPHLLVTNSRLGAYNGLHLAYLAATVSRPTRVVVYGDADHIAVARQTQSAGAFYVPGPQIATVLPGYVNAQLPPEDRRALARPDRRRQSSRGGRRATDFVIRR